MSPPLLPARLLRIALFKWKALQGSANCNHQLQSSIVSAIARLLHLQQVYSKISSISCTTSRDRLQRAAASGWYPPNVQCEMDNFRIGIYERAYFAGLRKAGLPEE